MPLSDEEFRDAVNKTCPICASGNKPRWRADTSEFVHDVVANLPKPSMGGTTRHTFCLATGRRKSLGPKEDMRG